MGPKRTSMDGLLHKAYKMLYNLTHEADEDSFKRYNDKIQDKAFALKLIKHAKGLAFMTEIKTSVLFSAHAGTGIVIGKTDGKWGGPHAVASSGIGFGLTIGGSTTDRLVIMNSTKFVKAFASKIQFRLGGDAQITAGPVGRDASAGVGFGDKGVQGSYNYSGSRGLYFGLTVDTDIYWPRKGCDKKFWGNDVDPLDIVQGKVQPPANENLEKIYTLLNEICEGKYDTAQKDAKAAAKEKKKAEKEAAKANEEFAMGESKEDTSLAPTPAKPDSNGATDTTAATAAAASAGIAQNTPHSPVLSSEIPKGFAKVTNTYVPREGEDQCIAINAGELVEVSDDTIADWWYGKNAAGIEGYFPQNAIEHSTYVSAVAK